MPRKDGTGPQGMGSMTGRGLGSCKETGGDKSTVGQGMGLCRTRKNTRCGLRNRNGRNMGRR